MIYRIDTACPACLCDGLRIEVTKAHDGATDGAAEGRFARAWIVAACGGATSTGEPGAVDDAVTLLDPPPGAEVLGPVDLGEGESRVVVRVPRAHGAALSHALGQLQRVRSSRKLDAVRIQVDPPTL